MGRAKKTSGRGNFIPKTLKRKSDLSRAKVRLWQLCKEIVRKRYGNTCYTCGKKGLFGSNWHTAHFIPSSICSAELRYELRNLRPCCYHCNVNLSGNWPAYEKALLKEGVDIGYLKRWNEETKGESYRLDWFEEQIERYQLLLEK